MNKLPTIQQLKELHTKFCNMYNGPLVGICTSYIHIEEEYATRYAPLDEWTVLERDDKEYPIEIKAVVSGLKLVAIMPKSKAIELGFVKEAE